MMRAAVLVEYNNEEINNNGNKIVWKSQKNKDNGKELKKKKIKNGSVVRKEGGGQQNANN
jgi:hypothetical protein